MKNIILKFIVTNLSLLKTICLPINGFIKPPTSLESTEDKANLITFFLKYPQCSSVTSVVKILKFIAINLIFISSSFASLKSISEIRELSSEEANSGIPISLTTQVVHAEDGVNGFYVFDGRHGIFVKRAKNWRDSAPPKVGDIVKINGKSLMGGFMPAVQEIETETIAHKALPEGIPYNPANLFASGLDCRFVSVRARLMSISRYESRMILLEFEIDSGHFPLYATVHYSPENMEKLSQKKLCLVEFSGVANTIYNQQHQITGRIFAINSADDIRVLPEKQIAPKSEKIHDILRFGSKARTLLSTRGTVLNRSENELILRGEQSCLQVSLDTNEPIKIGDFVEVEGFAVPNSVAPIFLARSIKIIESRENPKPRLLDLSTINPESIWIRSFCHTFHKELIFIDAEVLEIGKTFDRKNSSHQNHTILCRSNHHLFKAILPPEIHLPDFIKRGCIVRLTGICDLLPDTEKTWQLLVSGFELTIRDESDITLLKKAPWLNSTRLKVLLAIFSGIAVLGVIWSLLLRKEVQRKTRIIAENIKTETILNERQRVARELHDNLEQGLAGMTIQLKGCLRLLNLNANRQLKSLDDLSEISQIPEFSEELKKDTERSQKAVEIVQGILAHCRSESRSAIMDLRDGLLEKMNLKDALYKALSPLAEECNADLSINFSDENRRLNQMAERNLFVMVREAVTNAVRHGKASKIEVSFDFEKESLRVLVKDNGCGFDVASLSASKRYGVLGMQERIHQLGGKISVESEKEKGTAITAILSSLTDWELK